MCIHVCISVLVCVVLLQQPQYYFFLNFVQRELKENTERHKSFGTAFKMENQNDSWVKRGARNIQIKELGCTHSVIAQSSPFNSFPSVHTSLDSGDMCCKTKWILSVEPLTETGLLR